MKHFVAVVLIMVGSGAVLARDISLTPQMGWNSWNKFACNISESLIRETADSLVASGLAELGYNYVNLDDCWQSHERDSNGRLQPDPTRFPSGMKAIGDYLHSKGLKFGIYSSAGFQTCQAFPAALGVEEVDAASYAEWGVDYLKFDNCYSDHGPPQKRFKPMSDALDATGRPIFFSLCEWGRENPAAWAPALGGNSWRTTPDIRDDWHSVTSRALITASLWRYSGPNTGWNDPDMLEVGNGGCTDTEYFTHFSLWAIMKSPLIIGNDIRGLNVNDQTNAMEVLSNKEVIAVNQDSLGRQGRIVWSDMADKLVGTGHNSRLIATKCATGAAGAYEDAAADQEWAVQADGTIKSGSTGQCLNELERNEDLASLNEFFNLTIGHKAVSTADCAVATKWNVGQSVGASIVSRSSGLCLEVAKFEYTAVIQGKRIQTATCQGFNDKVDVDIREHQSWVAPNNVQLRNIYQRQCLTVDRDAYSGLQREIWAAPLSDGIAVVLFNKGPVELPITLSVSMLGAKESDGSSSSYRLRDLWQRKDLLNVLGPRKDVTLMVQSHGVVMLKLTPVVAV